MTTLCSHCGHEFETSEDLAACPKCEQVSMTTPTTRVPIRIKPSSPSATEYLGLGIIVFGVIAIVFVNLFVGAFLCFIGLAVAKFKS